MNKTLFPYPFPLLYLGVIFFVTQSGLSQIQYQKKPHQVPVNEHHFSDPYFWLSNTKDTTVLNALKKENEYFDSRFDFKNAYSQEVQMGRYQNAKPQKIEMDDSETFQYAKESYTWMAKEAPAKCVLLTQKGDTLFSGKDYLKGFKFQSLAISQSQSSRYFGVFLDTLGNGTGTFEVFDLVSKSFVVSVPKLTSILEWSATKDEFYYVKPNNQTGRYEALYSYSLEKKEELLIYFEPNTGTHVYPLKMSNGGMSVIEDGNDYSNQNLIIDNKIHPLIKSQSGVYTQVETNGESYFLSSNLHNKYYSIYQINKGKKVGAETLLLKGGRNSVIQEFYLRGNHLIIKMNNGPIQMVKTLNWKTKEVFDYPNEHEVVAYDFEKETINPEVITLICYPATSPFEYHYLNLETHEIQKSLPEFKKPELFNSVALESKVVYALASDGVKVPVSLVYKKGLALDGNHPVELEVYGAYGSISFASSTYLNWPFLKNGGVIAYAHVRGGGEYGEKWSSISQNGNKMITVTDVVACAKRLIDLKYTRNGGVFLYGGSAGGVANARAFQQAPELFGGMCLRVPFLDVVTTMSDSLIPGVVAEYSEWGNPRIETMYPKMESYDPYRNLSKAGSAPVLIFSSLNDTRVMSWEAHKYVARFREFNKLNAPIYLKTYMNVGHFYRNTVGEAAVRYSYWMDLFNAN